jgi:transposase InsO family protein
MRYSQSEKVEIIRLIEKSELAVKKTLKELGINRSTFYNWYGRYLERGYDGLADKKPTPRKFWNKIPEDVKEHIVEVALEYPEKSPRELAWFITDNEGYFISESSVYRILKSYDLITSPAYIVLSAKDKFDKETKRVNELWQTDFSYFKIKGWGWYYLSTVMDDYSRYIISWKLCRTMSATDVKETLDKAAEVTGVDCVKVRHKPRLLSDNGPCYLSSELRDYLEQKDIKHIRGAPFHPQTQGKIERYHRSIKNVVNLENYYFPWELEKAIEEFVEYYNHHRYHESLDNLKPVDVFFGRDKQILWERQVIKERTMKQRKHQNLKMVTTKKVFEFEESVP